MDRNPPVDTSSVRVSVALRKESVDRNSHEMSSQEIFWPSLSARRAWIEIITRNQPSKPRRAWIEIVVIDFVPLVNGSLSARRAWIEIPAGCWRDSRRASLSARRAWIEIVRIVFVLLANGGRSPQGERG